MWTLKIVFTGLKPQSSWLYNWSFEDLKRFNVCESRFEFQLIACGLYYKVYLPTCLYHAFLHYCALALRRMSPIQVANKITTTLLTAKITFLFEILIVWRFSSRSSSFVCSRAFVLKNDVSNIDSWQVHLRNWNHTVIPGSSDHSRMFR